LNDDPLRAYIGPIYLLLAPARATPGLLLGLLDLHSASMLHFGGRFKLRWCCRCREPPQEALGAGRARSSLHRGPRPRRRTIDNTMVLGGSRGLYKGPFTCLYIPLRSPMPVAERVWQSQPLFIVVHLSHVVPPPCHVC